MARLSYFAEKREQNNDPNFFSRIPIDEIRKNVKRIVRDVKNGLISDQDYLYFTNQQVLQACIAESYQQYTSANLISNAINFYLHEGIDKGIRLFPSMNVNQERITASNEQANANAKAHMWFSVYQMFVSIDQQHLPPQQALQYITLFSGRDMSIL